MKAWELMLTIVLAIILLPIAFLVLIFGLVCIVAIINDLLIYCLLFLVVALLLIIVVFAAYSEDKRTDFTTASKSMLQLRYIIEGK